MAAGDFVPVYSQRTGRKRLVPPHYLDNPRLMVGLSRTPRDVAGHFTPASNETAGSAETAPVDPETPAPAEPIVDEITETPATGENQE